MKKQDPQCKQHLALIEQLLNENTLLKQKYETLLKEYEKLNYNYSRLSKHAPQAVVKHIEGGTGIQEIDDLTPMGEGTEASTTASRFSKNVDVQLGDISLAQEFRDIHEMHQGNVKKVEKMGSKEGNVFEKTSVDIKPTLYRASRSSSRSNSFADKFFPLIQGCFIIQKKKCYTEKSKNSLSQMLQFIYPQQLAKTQKQTLQIMLKYTFVNPEITKFHDDQFSSRKNEIIFGTPYEDYMYAFQDGKWVGRRELPQIMKLMGTMKKKYCHVLVKPEIVDKEEFQAEEGEKKEGEKKEGEGVGEQGDYFYETETIYGFISPFPLRSFFQDLQRTIQQQLKYSQFQIDEHNQQIYNPTPNRKNKYKLMGKIMQKLYSHDYKINKFPLEMEFSSGITKIQLHVPTVVAYRDGEDQFLMGVFGRYNGGKVCKLLHYVLAEKCVLVQAIDRKALNQVMEMIRIFIRPFLWIFAIVYVYSDYFQPFMSSPMPIIIGKVTEYPDSQQPSSSKQLKRQSSIDYSEFCHIKMDNEELDLKQSQPYYKVIKKLKKQWDKCQNSKKDSRVALIHSYVHSLRVFIEKGVLNSEPTDFHIDFIETQMVSYFKDTKDE